MKLKLLLSAIAFAAACMGANAQQKTDTLVTVNGKVIYAQNMKIGKNAIMYTEPGQRQVLQISLDRVKTINSSEVDNLTSTIVTDSGSSITCKITGETADQVQYVEKGGSQQLAIGKDQIDKIISPDGSIKTFEAYKKLKQEKEEAQKLKQQRAEQRAEMLEEAITSGAPLSYSNKGRGRIMAGNVILAADEYKKMCASIDDTMEQVLWNMYCNGSEMRTAGTIMISVGVPVAAVSMALLIASPFAKPELGPSLYKLGNIFIATGGMITLSGIPLYCIGVNRRKRSISNYNTAIQRQKQDLTLGVGVASTGGVGLMLNF